MLLLSNGWDKVVHLLSLWDDWAWLQDEPGALLKHHLHDNFLLLIFRWFYCQRISFSSWTFLGPKIIHLCWIAFFVREKLLNFLQVKHLVELFTCEDVLIEGMWSVFNACTHWLRLALLCHKQSLHKLVRSLSNFPQRAIRDPVQAGDGLEL